jgi:hypothetical protein
VKTTEIFVEQVLIGALVFGTALLPWWPEVSSLFASNGVGTLGGGVAALGAAYLVGILCDRLADTLTEDLERHHRLRFALAWPVLRDVAPPRRETTDWKDPFPEDELRLTVLRDAEPVVAWLDYHRSRARLTRALAVFLPAATFAAVLTVARLVPPAGWAPGPRLIVLVPVVYALVVLLGWRRRDHATLDARRPIWPLAPKTYEADAYHYGHDQGFAINDDASRSRRWRSLARVLLEDPSVQGAALLHATAIAVALGAGRAAIVGVAVAGAGLTVLSAWSWWRISATFRHYLRQAGRPLANPPRR